MPVRKAEASWEGGLREGKGRMKLGSGDLDVAFSFTTRFENEPGTNPEELIGAAHAGCFTMSLGAGLERAGFTAKSISTTANVTFEKTEPGFRITKIGLVTEATVDGVSEDEFQERVKAAKEGCPISNALSPDIEVTVEATLVSG